MKIHIQKPSNAFVGMSWVALLIGMLTYFWGLWNSNMMLVEKGFYFVLIILGLFSAVSIQKSVRDKIEGIKVTGIYSGLCWVSLGISILLLIVSLFNSTMQDMAKGFYGMSFMMSLFASVAVQKNVRDLSMADAGKDSEVSHVNILEK